MSAGGEEEAGAPAPAPADVRFTDPREPPRSTAGEAALIAAAWWAQAGP